MTPLNSTGGTRATISAQMCMDAGSDGTRAKRKQFVILLCLPMAPWCCCLILSGDFGRSPIYGHHRARHCSPITHVWARRTLSAMAIEQLIASAIFISIFMSVELTFSPKA